MLNYAVMPSRLVSLARVFPLYIASSIFQRYALGAFLTTAQAETRDLRSTTIPARGDSLAAGGRLPPTLVRNVTQKCTSQGAWQ
jgi:hypothetical protein